MAREHGTPVDARKMRNKETRETRARERRERDGRERERPREREREEKDANSKQAPHTHVRTQVQAQARHVNPPTLRHAYTRTHTRVKLDLGSDVALVRRMLVVLQNRLLLHRPQNAE